jgi:hypothetical protein
MARANKCFMLFRNVTVPQGATITSVHFYVTPRETTPLWLYPQTLVQANAVDNAVPPASLAEFLALARASAFFGHLHIPALTLNVETDVSAWSHDYGTMESVISEVINRPGWISGNNLMLIWTHEYPEPGHYSSFWSFEGDILKRPRMTIAYS